MTTMKKAGAPILEGKHAIVFGAGSIEAAVAREFAAEGAEVFLAGRTKSNLEETAKQITAAGGQAQAVVIDVLDDIAVNEYVAHIVKQAGKIDIILDAVSPQAKSTETPIWLWTCRWTSSSFRCKLW